MDMDYNHPYPDFRNPGYVGVSGLGVSTTIYVAAAARLDEANSWNWSPVLTQIDVVFVNLQLKTPS